MWTAILPTIFNRSTRTHHIAVAHHSKAAIVCTRIGIACDKQFVRSELSGTVEICRAAGFIGGECDYALNALINTGVNQVHCPKHISLYAFKWVVLRSGYNLCGSGVDDIVNTVERTHEAIFVSYSL